MCLKNNMFKTHLCKDVKSNSIWLQLTMPHIHRELHTGALEGVEGTLGKLKERFYWLGMQRDVQDC